MKVDNWVILNLMLSMLLVLYGSTMYWVGYHGNDLGHNMKWLECEFNTTLVDRGHVLLTGEPVVSTPSDAIRNGSYTRDSGVVAMLGGIFVFGVTLGKISPNHIKIRIPTWGKLRNKKARRKKKKK